MLAAAVPTARWAPPAAPSWPPGAHPAGGDRRIRSRACRTAPTSPPQFGSTPRQSGHGARARSAVLKVPGRRWLAECAQPTRCADRRDRRLPGRADTHRAPQTGSTVPPAAVAIELLAARTRRSSTPTGRRDTAAAPDAAPALRARHPTSLTRPVRPGPARRPRPVRGHRLDRSAAPAPRDRASWRTAAKSPVDPISDHPVFDAHRRAAAATDPSRPTHCPRTGVEYTVPEPGPAPVAGTGTGTGERDRLLLIIRHRPCRLPTRPTNWPSPTTTDGNRKAGNDQLEPISAAPRKVAARHDCPTGRPPGDRHALPHSASCILAICGSLIAKPIRRPPTLGPQTAICSPRRADVADRAVWTVGHLDGGAHCPPGRTGGSAEGTPRATRRVIPDARA